MLQIRTSCCLFLVGAPCDLLDVLCYVALMIGTNKNIKKAVKPILIYLGTKPNVCGININAPENTNSNYRGEQINLVYSGNKKHCV